jgi:hypothetical protein
MNPMVYHSVYKSPTTAIVSNQMTAVSDLSSLRSHYRASISEPQKWPPFQTVAKFRVMHNNLKISVIP